MLNGVAWSTVVGVVAFLWFKSWKIAAVIFAIGVMYLASGPVAGFIERHPTTRMLALSFLLMIGLALVADGLGYHIPRGYLYAAMGFSALVELLNVVSKRNRSKHEA